MKAPTSEPSRLDSGACPLCALELSAHASPNDARLQHGRHTRLSSAELDDLEAAEERLALFERGRGGVRVG